MQQPLEESMGGGHKPMLVEVHEGDDVAIGRQRRLLITRQNPLHGCGPHAEKTTSDEEHEFVGQLWQL
jgi:hypothetical protein